LLTETIGLKVVATDTEIAQNAALLRAKYSLKTIDAIHLATAIVAGCDAFLTNDHIFRRVSELRILVLDDLSRS
jgi:predicted nucleic acid-binding protein